MGAMVGADGLFGWSWQLIAAVLAGLGALALLVSLIVSRTRWTRTRILLNICFLITALVLAHFAPFPGPVPRAAPVSANARYYTVEPLANVLTPQGAVAPNTLLALSTRSGASLWRYHQAGSQDVWVLGASQTTVVVYNDTYPQAHVVALDAADGRVRWSFDVGAPGNVPGAQMLPGTDTLLIGDNSYVVSIDLATGEVRWRYAVPTPTYVVYPLLAFGNTVLVRAAAAYAPPTNPVDVRLFALGAQDGALRWQADLGPEAPLGRTMAAAGEVICAETGAAMPGSAASRFGLAAFAVTTGTVLWQDAFAQGEVDPYQPTEQVFASGNTCFVMHKQSLLALDTDNGTPRFVLPGSIISVPRGSSVRFNAALSDGTMLYVAAGPTRSGAWDIETVYAISTTNGQVTWRFRTDSNAAGLTLSPQRTYLFVSSPSRLTVLSPTDGHVRWKTSRQLTSMLDPADATASPALSAATASPEVTFLTGPLPTCLLVCLNQQTYLWAVASSSGMPYWRVPLGPPEVPYLPFH